MRSGMDKKLKLTVFLVIFAASSLAVYADYAPLAWIESSVATTRVNVNFQLYGSAIDDMGLKYMKVYFHGAWHYHSCNYETSCSKTWTISESEPGTYTYKILAEDTSGKTSSDEVKVVIVSYCGDGICSADESCSTCAADCGTCGPVCGNGDVEAGEECELPNTHNNAYCPQSTWTCSGKRTGTRDSYGDCDFSCSCDYDAFSYSCIKGSCGAECSIDADCSNKCVGDVYYYNGDCTSGCECTYLTEDCNQYDGWYDTGNFRWVSMGQCTEKKQKEREYRDHICSVSYGGCDYSVTDTQWVDTGETRNKEDGTTCDDGLFCTVNDACIAGVCDGETRDCSDGISCTEDFCNEMTDSCSNLPDDNLCNDGLWCNGEEYCDAVLDCQSTAPVDCDDGISCTIDSCNEETDSCTNEPDNSVCDNGLYCDGSEYCDVNAGCQAGTPVDCSANDILVAECFYVPDGVNYTFDYYSFTSMCDELNDECTTAPSNWEDEISHTCDINQCGAVCETDADCDDNNPDTIDICLEDCICSHVTECVDEDGDGYSVTGGDCGPIDCDDNNSEVYPGAEEICDGIDNDCDGLVDEEDVCGQCTDADGDGYNVEGGDCGPVDCDDTNAAVNPGATEVCNGIDDDCDTFIDEDVCISNLSVAIVADKTAGEAPLEVNFDADVSGGTAPFAYAWDFNNDGIIDSITKSVKTIFKAAGSYLVRLTVVDFGGDTATDTLTIDVAEVKRQVKIPKKKIHINRINIVNDQLKAGEDLVVYVSFENYGNYKIKDASATVIVPELGLRQKTRNIDLKTNKGVTKKFIVEIPEGTEPGFYDVMIIIYDNGLKRVRYRPIEVIG
jgi:hypothetical protein